MVPPDIYISTNPMKTSNVDGLPYPGMIDSALFTGDSVFGFQNIATGIPTRGYLMEGGTCLWASELEYAVCRSRSRLT